MSIYRRAEQIATFTRMWHLFDAKWQNPFQSAELLSQVLCGKHKPIYHETNDCGDHIVVINSKEISMPWYEWKYRMYYHHTDFAKGGSWTAAWELHDKDPTKVLWKAVYRAVPGNLLRGPRMARLHIFADDNIPKDIKQNLSAQLRQLRPVPKKLDEYTPEEIAKFPKVFEFPKDFMLK